MLVFRMKMRIPLPKDASGRRKDIQGLRAIAVLFVLTYHSGLSILPGGYVGVDVFFVISGFLISGMLVDERLKFGRIGLIAFYARRFRRLLPASALVILSTLFAAHWFYAPLQMKQLTSDAIATAVYLSNFWFAHLATDYLTAHGEASPLLHTWSLSVEEQFYFFWPAFLILVTKYARSNDCRRTIALSIASMVALSLILSIILTSESQPHAFFGSPTRAWEFGLGALIPFVVQDKWRGSMAFARFAGWAGLAMVFTAAFVYSSSTAFPGVAALLPVAGTCLIIAFPLAPHESILQKVLSFGPLQYIGNISYSLYLWHWPVFVFIGMSGLSGHGFNAAVGILISMSLATATYFGLENPVRFNRRLKENNWLGLALCGLIMVVVVGAGMAERAMSSAAVESSVHKRFAAAARDFSSYRPEGCEQKIPDEAAEPCIGGVTDAKTDVVLFGDSHAAHWFPAFDIIASREGFRLLLFTKSGCPSVAMADYVLPALGRNYTECSRWREKVLRVFEQNPPDFLILSNSYGSPRSDAGRIQQWGVGIDAVLGRLNGIGVPTAVVRGTPLLEFDVPTCLSRASWQGGDATKECSFRRENVLNEELDRIEVSTIQKYPNAHRLDMLSAICASPPCTVERDGMVLFRDKSHLTTTFSRSLADELQSSLSDIFRGFRRRNAATAE